MGFLKWRQRSGDGGLHWGRADRDGAPFRGQQLPLLKDEEFDTLAERVMDCYHATFDTSQPEQRLPKIGHPSPRTYQEILDGIACNWFQLMSPRQYMWTEKSGEPTMHVFVEWGEPYMECAPGVTNSLGTKVTPIGSEKKK